MINVSVLLTDGTVFDVGTFPTREDATAALRPFVLSGYTSDDFFIVQV